MSAAANLLTTSSPTRRHCCSSDDGSIIFPPTPSSFRAIKAHPYRDQGQQLDLHQNLHSNEMDNNYPPFPYKHSGGWTSTPTQNTKPNIINQRKWASPTSTVVPAKSRMLSARTAIPDFNVGNCVNELLLPITEQDNEIGSRMPFQQLIVAAQVLEDDPTPVERNNARHIRSPVSLTNSNCHHIQTQACYSPIFQQHSDRAKIKMHWEQFVRRRNFREREQQWRNEKSVIQHRRRMIVQISNALKVEDTRATASPEMLQKLPQMVKQLEASLYSSAMSLKEYIDPSSLEHRLHLLSIEISSISHQKREESEIRQKANNLSIYSDPKM